MLTIAERHLSYKGKVNRSKSALPHPTKRFVLIRNGSSPYAYIESKGIYHVEKANQGGYKMLYNKTGTVG